MATKPLMRELGLVVVGDFNPVILQPAWLAAEGLIRPGDNVDATVEVVHRELAVFELPWMRLEATNTRLYVKTSQEPYFNLLRDLIVGILTLLEHTPVRALGINWGHYYSLPDRATYDKFGHALVPKEMWKPALDQPGTMRVAVRQPQPQGVKGYVDATVAKNDKFPNCIHIFINDHNQIDEGSNEKTTFQICDMLNSDRWNAIEKRPFELSESLFKGFM